MCDELVPASDNDKNAGRLWQLCKEHSVAHVMEIAGVQYPPISDDGLSAPGTSPNSKPELPGPGNGLYGAFCTLARTMFVEYNYFDLDHRSEVGELQEWSFKALKPTSVRLHFFTEAAATGEGHRSYLKRVSRASKAQSLGTSDSGVKVPKYLGYSVVRGTPGDPIGRSLVSPFANIEATLSDDSVLRIDYRVVHSQVRTAVTEHVSVLGVQLVAVGVPFMEQQGSLVRCAHVSAWICHYTASLRGFVPRRPIAHFHRMGGTYAAGRTFPSQGLTHHEVIQILGRSDMPAEVLDKQNLGRERRLNWTDRKVLGQRVEAAEAKDERNSSRGSGTELYKLWIKDNLSSSVCRYLNSGIPVMVLAEEHTVVIVGYLRRSDREDGVQSLPAYTTDTDHEEGPYRDLHDLLQSPVPGEADDDGRSDVEYFIVTDDQEGPFQPLGVGVLADAIRTKSARVLVPLPRGLSLTGRKAEQLGSRLLRLYIESAKRELLDRVDQGDVALTAEEAATVRFYQDVTTDLREKYTVRTYATTGIDLKASVDSRLSHMPELADSIATLPMPKYVWVMEVIDRSRRRRRRRHSVRATVVLDASRVDTKAMDDLTLLGQIQPLLLHFPGTTTLFRPLSNEPERIAGPFSGYPTGRWDHNQIIGSSAERVAVHSKGAVGTT